MYYQLRLFSENRHCTNWFLVSMIIKNIVLLDCTFLINSVIVCCCYFQKADFYNPCWSLRKITHRWIVFLPHRFAIDLAIFNIYEVSNRFIGLFFCFVILNVSNILFQFVSEPCWLHFFDSPAFFRLPNSLSICISFLIMEYLLLMQIDNHFLAILLFCHRWHYFGYQHNFFSYIYFQYIFKINEIKKNN